MTCTFCGERGPRAREDVIPQWVAAEVGGSAPIRVEQAHAQDGHAHRLPTRQMGSVAAFKYPDVCHDCNTGWMSDLEEQAKPILLPMIRGQQTSLSTDGLGIVAFWSIKTALMFDAFHQPRKIPADEGTRLVYRERKPFDHCQIRLGAYVAPRDGVWLPWARNTAHLTVEGPDHPLIEQDLVLIPFAFKHLLVWANVLVGNPVDGPFQGFRPPSGLEFVQAWPTVGRVDWPPPRAIDWSSFLMMTTENLQPPS